MSVVSSLEIWQGRDGEFGIDGVRTYSRVFRVQTNSNYDTAAAVALAGGLPRVGDPFPDDIVAFCQRVRPSQESFSPRVWIVNCSYSSKREIQDNPLDDPAEITWDTEQYQEIAVVDKDGDAIVNSCGDWFNPPPNRDFSRRIVTIKKNLGFVPTWILNYEDAVNSDAFTVDGFSVGKGKAKCQKVSISPVQFRNDIAYRSVTVVLHLSKNGWKKRILDAGFREINQDDPTQRKKITNADGSDPDQPVPLDGSGNALTDPTPSSVVVLEFDVYPELAFGGNLPLS